MLPILTRFHGFKIKKCYSYYKKNLVAVFGRAETKLWNILKKSQQHHSRQKHNLRWFTLQSSRTTAQLIDPEIMQISNQGTTNTDAWHC